ncbi:MAG: hypothetical protein HOB86_02230, partial [Rhodospirillaceae bacterium]|nr:hypothetical protein [Rhodospirillaceae bacterium]
MVLKRPLHCPTKVMESEAFETTVGEVVNGVASASAQLRVTAGSMAAAAEQ